MTWNYLVETEVSRGHGSAERVACLKVASSVVVPLQQDYRWDRTLPLRIADYRSRSPVSSAVQRWMFDVEFSMFVPSACVPCLRPPVTRFAVPGHPSPVTVFSRPGPLGGSALDVECSMLDVRAPALSIAACGAARGDAPSPTVLAAAEASSLW